MRLPWQHHVGSNALSAASVPVIPTPPSNVFKAVGGYFSIFLFPVFPDCFGVRPPCAATRREQALRKAALCLLGSLLAFAQV